MDKEHLKKFSTLYLKIVSRLVAINAAEDWAGETTVNQLNISSSRLVADILAKYVGRAWNFDSAYPLSEKQENIVEEFFKELDRRVAATNGQVKRSVSVYEIALGVWAWLSPGGMGIQLNDFFVDMAVKKIAAPEYIEPIRTEIPANANVFEEERIYETIAAYKAGELTREEAKNRVDRMIQIINERKAAEDALEADFDLEELKSLPMPDFGETKKLSVTIPLNLYYEIDLYAQKHGMDTWSHALVEIAANALGVKIRLPMRGGARSGAGKKKKDA